MLMALPLAMTSCSDSYMEDVNTDTTKSTDINPNAQLTTALLQTYGDFSMMDTYRSYITGFTQYFAGGWNVTNYAGSVHADNSQMALLWNRLYTVSIKNLVDAIGRTEETRPNLNAILRIQKVYLMSVLTDSYGDVPYFEAGHAEITSTPAYDEQKEIYYDFFKELDACIYQLQQGGSDVVTGDVTAYNGNLQQWARYANSLRMRYAMRISEVEPEKAREEFNKSLTASCGYIKSADDNAYVKYTNNPFTLYDGARDLDFRVNALGEILYGQSTESPSFICATLFCQMEDTNDPRLYRIARHYINTKRSEVQADEAGNVDVTDEVVAYQKSAAGISNLGNNRSYACNVGAAWYNNWVSAPDNADIPTLAALVAQDPEAGYNQSNYNVRMLRPFLSIKLEKAETPGVLMTSAEVEFLIAEALAKGWSLAGVSGDVASHYAAGVRQSMEMLNAYYDINKISSQEIDDFIAANPVGTGEQAIENINTQAWILHLMNPNEGWANLRRSGYPALEDRTKYTDRFDGFVYDDSNLTTPVRLKYPNLEIEYNSANYKQAIERLGGTDDWHKRVWWDVAADHVKYSL